MNKDWRGACEHIVRVSVGNGEVEHGRRAEVVAHVVDRDGRPGGCEESIAGRQAASIYPRVVGFVPEQVMPGGVDDGGRWDVALGLDVDGQLGEVSVGVVV